jgi:hypothetical protein
MARLLLLSLLVVAMLAGCGQVILFGHEVRSRSENSQPATPASEETPAETAVDEPAKPTAIAHAIKAVNLLVTAEATAKVTGDASRFSADALLEAIKTELRSRKLLDEQDPRASGTAEIIVDDLATRATTNAVVFGYKMLAGTLEGDIQVTAADGTSKSTGSRIVAESKLTVAANGEDKNPLGPLYRKFAVLVGDRLAGVTSTPPKSTGSSRY